MPATIVVMLKPISAKIIRMATRKITNVTVLQSQGAERFEALLATFCRQRGGVDQFLGHLIARGQWPIDRSANRAVDQSMEHAP